MSGLVNFLLVVSVVSVVWIYMVVRKKQRTANEELQGHLAECAILFDADNSDAPEEVFSALRFMADLPTSSRHVKDEFEANLILETKTPTDEGGFAFLTESQRDILINAAERSFIVLFLHNPRRWSKHLRATTEDPGVLIRSFWWLTQNAQSRANAS